MGRRDELPPELRGRAFTVEQAASAGVSRSRSRANDLEAPYRGVRAPAGPHGLRGRCIILSTRLSQRHFFSHVTAAALWGMPLPRRLESTSALHVTATRGREPRVRGVVGHVTMRPVATVELAGVRVSSAVDTWCDLWGILTVDELVIAGDGLLRRKSPLASHSQLTRAVAERAGSRGSARAREALDLIRAGTDSREETRVRLVIVRAGLPEPLVNVSIRDDGGGFVALGDLVYPHLRVLIEYDGGHHFSTAEQVLHDVDRLEAVMELGWRVIRVNKTHSDHWIVQKVARALQDAANRQ